MVKVTGDGTKPVATRKREECGKSSLDGAGMPGAARGPAARGRPKKDGKIEKAVGAKIDRYLLRGREKPAGAGNVDAFAKSDKIPYSPEGGGGGKGKGAESAATVVDEWNEEDEEGVRPLNKEGEEVGLQLVVTGNEQQVGGMKRTGDEGGRVAESEETGDSAVLREMKRLEERIVELVRTEAEKIRREIVPLPCRCERMNEIIKGLLAEAEEWKMCRYRDKVEWEEEKEILIGTIREQRRKIEEWESKDVNNNSKVEGEPGAESFSRPADKRQVNEVESGVTLGSRRPDSGERGQLTRQAWVSRVRGDTRAVASSGSQRSVEEASVGAVVDGRRSRKDPERRGKPSGLSGATQRRDWKQKTQRRSSSASPCQPGALGESVWRRELQERCSRKRNIVVRGVKGGGSREEIGGEISQILEARMGVEPEIVKVEWSGGGAVITLNSLGKKVNILRKRGELRGTGVWIEDDLTAREAAVAAWLRREAERMRRKGRRAQVGYMKLCVDGVWWQWVEREGELEKMTFASEREAGELLE